MREIKFRAWQPSIKTMVQIESFDCVRQPPFWYQACLNFQEGAPVTTNAINRKDEPDFILMQYTGLKDKNGKEIYEGDIIVTEGYIWFDRGKPNYRGTVEWIYSQWQIVPHCINPNKRGISDGVNEGLNDDGIDEGKNSYWEIIGNVYENPELLEEK